MIRSIKNVLALAVFTLFSISSLFPAVECKSNFQREELCHEYNYCGDSSVCENGRNGTLNYFKATGPNDTLHYAWSTIGYPTVFISHSSVPKVNDCVSSFHVKNYTEFLNNQSAGSVSIDDSLTNFAFALIFKRLFEFKVNRKKLKAAKAFDPEEAKNCSANLTQYCNYRMYQLNNHSLQWMPYNEDRGMRGKDNNSSFILALKVNPRHDEGYEHSYAPKPWYTANSTTFDLLLKNFVYQLPNSNSRLALEVDFVQGLGVSDHGTIGRKYSKDDEYTPSIFYTRFFSFGGKHGHGHLRWKPITYLTHHRKSSQSQQINSKLGGTVNSSTLPGSLARAIFGDNYSHATTVYLVFGTEKDDSALNSGMYTWSGSIGYGDQPDEPFSTLVILVIAIGLGIPAVLTVLAVSYVFTLNFYRWHKSRQGYRRI